MKTASELFDKVLKMTTDELYCTLPCQVVAVENNYVDVKVFINDDEPDMILYHVPIQRPETQRAYIYLGIKSGDRGTLKFFDRSVEGYLQSDFDYNSDDRQHDISDRAFELGFIPDKEAYVYPSETQILPVDEILPNFNSDDFNTKLTDEEELEYQQWYEDMKSQGYILDGDVGYDYDFRGAFKAGFSPSEVGGHWVDTWKKPNHQTFSNESIYAKGEYAQYAGTWDGDNFKTPDSRIMPNPEIEIALKNGFCKISINADGSLSINSTVATTVTAPTVTINGNVVVNGTINATGEITGNGIPLSTHIHGNGNQGADTTAPKG